MFYAKTAVFAISASVVNGHMVMTSPSPWAGPSDHLLTNGPLEADASNFPCKFDGLYTASGGTTNTYALGSEQELAFMGTAVHGGGSCQVWITYDQPPTANSKFKVIHSIEGGCPARNTPGNIDPANANAPDPFTYNYTIPDNIPAGKGSIGFSWLNRIGNREFYQNCGPLELTGKGGPMSNFESLPDMVVMNIGSNPLTTEGSDYKFADPGKSVEDNTGANPIQTVGSAGSSSGSSGSDSGSGSSEAPVPTSSAPATPASSGGVFLTVGGSSAATPATTAAATTVATSSAAASTPTGSNSGSSSGAMTGACTTEGTWNCMGSSYQQCASGIWSAVMPLAAGTSCTPGQSSNMDIKAVSGKRAARGFRA